MAIRRRRGSGRMGRRRGRGIKALPAAAGLAGWAVNGIARAGARYAARAAARMATRRGAALTAAGLGVGGLAANSRLIGKKRRAAPAMATGSKRRRIGARKGTYEVRKSRSRFGRRPVVTTRKLAALAVRRRILRFQALSLQDNVNSYALNGGLVPGLTASTGHSGRYPMTYTPNWNSGTSDLMPFYVVRLYSTNNTQARSPLSVMSIATDGKPNFNNLNGFSAGGVLDPDWSYEYISGANSTGAANARWIQPMWYDIRLLMYGARGQQSQFIVEYVQLNDDHFDPEWDGAIGTGRVGDLFQERLSWYHQQVRSLITNPISTPYAASKVQGWRVLKRWVYNIAPHLTIESDSTPNSQVARLFIRDGRILSYNERSPEIGNTGMDDNIRDPNKFVKRDNAAITLLDHPGSAKARRMLIIRCSNAVGNNGLISDDNVPSFDLLVRKKEAMSDV